MRLCGQKRGKNVIVERCIDCPKLSKCETGAWANPHPASGPIPFECPLPPCDEKGKLL